MNLFRKKEIRDAAVSTAVRSCGEINPGTIPFWEKELYDRLRFTVPVIDAAIGKIIRLTGGYRVLSSDENM